MDFFNKLRTKAHLLFLILLFFTLAGPFTKTYAATLLVSKGTYSAVYTYGGSSWVHMSAALQTAFGGSSNITIANDLASPNISTYSAIMVDLRLAAATFTSTEITNLQNFINGGGRVFIVGENQSWPTWDNSLLTTVGGSNSGQSSTGSYAPSGTNVLTSGVSLVTVSSGGVATGGTSLFTTNFATLWGTSQNALTILDVNALSDNDWSLTSNATFGQNIANWLAASNGSATPTPTTAPTLTPTPTPTPTSVPPTSTPTPTPTAIPPTATPTNSPTPTPTLSVPTPTVTPAITPTISLTATPQPTPSPSTNNTQNTTTCSASSPSGTPNLYQVDPSLTDATIYFTPVLGADSYVIEYGNTSSANQYSVSLSNTQSSGAIAYTIQDLQSATTYYFSVRAGNGCAPGNWSSSLSTTTFGGTVTSNPISAVVTQVDQTIAPTKKVAIVSSKLTTTPSNVCSYTVEPGDSLWSIAQDKLDDGSKFLDIKMLNNLSSTILSTGATLQLPCNAAPQTIAKAQQEVQQKGVVLNIHVLSMNNQPVVGAIVTLHSRVQMAKTDKDGIAHFTNVEKGQHTVLLAYNGFTGKQQVTIQGQAKQLTLSMQVQLKGFSSPLVITVIGIMGGIIILLAITLLIVLRKYKKNQKLPNHM